MATYSPQSLGIKADTTGGVFKDGAWYGGRQYYGGTLGDPGTIHPNSSQQGAGQAVSAEVNKQSAQAQGVPYSQFDAYIKEQAKKSATPAPSGPSTSLPGMPGGNKTPGSTGPGGVSMPASPTLDLPSFYKSLYDSSGISTLEADLAAKESAKTEVLGKINDNPYLSEGTRVGRIAKVEELHTNRTLDARNQIATKKADIETKLALETKQFDINSQVAQAELNKFQVLLTSGALDNASGDDIANITRATGISSDMIYSAVNYKKQKDVKTSMIQYDDGTDQGFVVVDEMGNIINKQVVAPSKPDKGSADLKETDYVNLLKEDAGNGTPLSKIFSIYSGFLDADTIYQIYNSSSSWGPDPAKNISKLAGYGVTQPKSTSDRTP